MKWDGTNYIYTRVDGTEYKMKDPFPSLTKKYWNLNSPWNLEQKITWDEIAPSLQELILVCRYIEWEDLGPGLQGKILDDESKIESNAEAITNEISDREDAVDDLQEQLTSLITNVTAITNRISSVESTVLSIQNNINTEIKPVLTNLSDRIDTLDEDIEKVWGSELYRVNHSQYNIYQIWQKMTELVQRMEALENAMINIQNTIGDYDDRISDLERRVRILETKVEDLEGRVTVLEEKTQIYIDQFISLPNSTRNELFIHFNNNFTIQTCYAYSCDVNDGNRSFEDIVDAGYNAYDANNKASTAHYYISNTQNVSGYPSDPTSVLGTINNLSRPFLNDQYICLIYTDEIHNNFYTANNPGGTDTRALVIARPYDQSRVLVSSVLIDEVVTIIDHGIERIVPRPISNGVSFVAMGFANKVS